MVDLRIYDDVFNNIINLVSVDLKDFTKKYLIEHKCRHLYTISLIEKHISKINIKKSKITILDVGPFPGLIAAYFSKKGHEVVALEFPRKDLNFYKKVYDHYNINLFYLDLTTITRYNFYEKSNEIKNKIGRFNIILMFEVIEHIPAHPLPIMKFITNILEDEGWLLFSTPNMFYYINRYKFIRGIEPFPLYRFNLTTGKGHFREYSEHELSYIFKNLPVKEIEMTFLNENDMCKEMNVIKNTMTSSVLKRFGKKLIESFINFVGKTSSTKRYIFINAKK